MRERRKPRRGAALAALVVVLAMTGFWPGTSPDADGAAGTLRLERRVTLAPGVEHLRYSMASPLNVIEVAKVRAGSNMTVKPVLSGNVVIGSRSSSPGLETTSSMCRRAGALVCVNGDFTACPSCTAPLGGVVRHGEVLRGPNPSWPQLTIAPGGGFGAGSVRVDGSVTASYRATPTRAASSTALILNGVNGPLPSNGVMLYTPAYAASTRSAPGTLEVRVIPDGPAVLNRTITLREVGGIRTSGNASIPSNAFILSASGSAAQHLRALRQGTAIDRSRLASVTLRLRSSVPVNQSLGGHPVILRGGQPLAPPQPGDTASQVRHPRTVVGWNAAGDLWLVTIDGRQPGRSAGVTYWEAASVLRQLGATDGINLDGGGSTTFVARECSGSVCVRNRPSDGRERAVTTALTVVPRR